MYDAAIRLSQDFKMRYPLVDVYGGNGSIINDSYAASRYTKIRLSKYGELMLRGIKKHAVPMVDNYSGDEKEPLYLPSVFPAILCNGNLGIGIGLSTGTAPFNLKEVCDAIELVIDNSNVSCKDIMKVLPAPDFPTGGVLMNTPEEILNIYTTGKGSYNISCKYHTEKIDGQEHIIITEIPYLVSIEKHIINPIKKMVNEEEYPYIDELKDLCGNNKLEFHIILTKNANLFRVIKDLTDKGILSQRYKINHTINRNNVFSVMSIKDMINEYISNRHTCIINESIFDRDNAKAKLHILEGLIIALEDIDRVVEIIKKSKDRASAQKTLIETYPLDEEQAKAILDMRLAKLTSLEVETLKEDIKNLKAEIIRLEDIIHTKEKRNNLIKEDLVLLRNMSDSRRTTLGAKKAVKMEDKDIVVIVEDNMIKAIDPEKLPSMKKGAKGSVLGKNNITTVIKTKTNTSLLAVDNQGEGSMIDTNFIPFVEDIKENGVDYHDFFQGGDIVKLLAYNNEKYLIATTSKGYIKKSLVSDYNNFKKHGKLLKLREEDTLVDISFANDNDILTTLGQGRLYNTEISKIKTMGKITFGMKSNIEINDSTVTNSTGSLLVWNTEGSGHLTAFSELSEHNSISAEDLLGVLGIEDNPVFVLGEKNKGFVLDSSEIGFKSLKAKGSKLYGGDLVKIEKL